MMDSALITVYASDLTTPVKALFALVYAHAGEDGKAVIAQETITEMLHLGPDTLRQYRRKLAAAGFCDSYARGGLVAFTINRDLIERREHLRNGESVSETERASALAESTGDTPKTERASAKRREHLRNGESISETERASALEKSPHTPLMIDRLIEDVKLINNQSINPGAPARGIPAVTLPADPDLTADEIAANLALLAEAGIAMPKRAEIAAALKPETLYRQYADWQRKHDAGRVYSPGALIAQCVRYPDPPPLTRDDRNSRAYRVFMAAAYPDTQTAADDEADELPPSATGDWEPWPAILQQLARQMTRSTFDLHLRASRADADGDQIVVTAPSRSSAAWLDVRLRPVVERAARAVVGRDLSLSFIGADQ